MIALPSHRHVRSYANRHVRSYADTAGAWLCFAGHVLCAIVGAAALLVMGLGSQLAGDRMLPARPEAAVLLLNFWLLAQLALGAVAAAGTIVVTVALTAPDSASAQTKQLLSALATALTAFLTATLTAGDAPDEKVGDRVRQHFYTHYKRVPSGRVRRVAPESEAEKCIYSDEYCGISGWGSESRYQRAKKLAEILHQEGGGSSPRYTAT